MSSDLINRPFGGALYWDDLRVPVTATVAAGSNPPEFSLLRDNGAPAPAGYSIQFDGINDYATIPHDDSGAADVFDFSAAWSLSFWAIINAGNPNNATLFYHPQWNLRIGPTGILRVSLSGKPDQTSAGAYNIGARNHIVLVVDDSGGNTHITLYVNNNIVLDNTVGGALAADGGGDVNVASNAGTTRFLAGRYDNIRFFNTALSATNVSDLYNDEAGTEDPVAAPNTVCYYKLNEGAGVTAADSIFPGPVTHTMTLTNGVAWAAGLVEITNPEQGVFSWSFSPDAEEELFFTCQLPHTWIEYAFIHPHVHWAADSAASGTVVWGLEYVWANVGEALGNTTVLTVDAVAGGEKVHQLSAFDNINGSDKRISSMLIGRIFRKATDANDTYTGRAFLLEIDFHFQYNHGSQREVSKWYT